jgi:uncharacterized protein (DUF1800 family)
VNTAARLLGVALAGLLGCSTIAPTTGALPRAAHAPKVDDGHIVHVLNRVSFGPKPGDVARVRAIGLEAYLEQQLHPERLDDSAVDRALSELPSLEMPIATLLREYPQPDPATRQKIAAGEMTREEVMARYPVTRRPARVVAELQAAKIVRAVGSERQLQEVMVDFWFNHFNVFAGKGPERWYVGAYEREAIRPHALGKFRELVRATARHPAMLYYLDNWLSARSGFVVPVGRFKGRRGGLNENYARELMELHTLGVDAGYTQHDVTEVARAFTGWTIDRPQVQASYMFRPAMHDIGAKRVLGVSIPAGGGEGDGELVIDLLTRHPATARFIAGKLARRFVADDAPPALVDRIAATYTQSDGDIRLMLRTIFNAPEFASTGARRAKVKKPLELVASALRALGGRVEIRGGFALARAVAEIGEPLYGAQPPTGHADRADAWISTGSLLARMNFAVALTANRYPGVEIALPALAVGADGAAPEPIIDALLSTAVGDSVTPTTRAVLLAQARQAADDEGQAKTIDRLAALVIGSPEFQRR